MSKVTILNYFEKQAEKGIWGSLYDSKTPKSYPFIVRFQKGVSLMEPVNNKTVLDLGCGTGVLIPYVIDNGGKYIGIDISQNMINKAKAEYSNYLKSEKISLYLSDIESYKPSDKADIIVGLGFIEYFDNPQLIINKLYDELPVNGQLVLSFPNFYSLDYFGVMLTKPIRSIIRVITGKSTDQPPRKLWGKKMAIELFKNAGFKEEKLLAYNVNVFAYPFTKISLRFTNFFAKKLEYSWLSKKFFFCSGFLISGKK